jgi:hypothetical protein
MNAVVSRLATQDRAVANQAGARLIHKEGRWFREPSTTGCPILGNLAPVTFFIKKTSRKIRGVFCFYKNLFYPPGVEEISVVFVHRNDVA